MKTLYKTFLAIALGIFSLQVQALLLDPAVDCTAADLGATCWTTDVNSNLDAAAVSTLIGYGDTLTELYKQDVEFTAPDDGESGLFASSYDTIFSNTDTEPEDATITYTGGDSIICGDCFLLIKDGNQTIAQYVFDISNWDGTDLLEMINFWPTNGAISHVAIYGGSSTVPEPGMVGLLAIGLLGMVVTRRRMKL